jgi:hypothetical protein
MVAIVLHVVLVVYHFNPRLQFGQGRPLTGGDLSFHFASAMEASDYLRERHVLWGYSPSYMAGYPFGLWNSTSHRGYELAANIVPFVRPELAYYAFVVGSAIATPFVLLLVCPAVGMSGSSQWVVLLLALGLFQFDAQVSYFWTFGNVAFPLAAALATVFTALISTPGTGPLKTLWAGLLLGAIAWLNPLGMIPAAVGSLVAIGFSPCRKLRLVVCLGLASVVAVAIASPWLIPLLRFREVASPMTIFPLQADLKSAIMDLFSDRGYQLPYDRRATLHALLTLAIFGAYSSYRARRSAPVSFFVAGVALFALTYTVGYVPALKHTQPYRFMIAYEWFWVIPAAVGVEVFLTSLRRTNGEGRLVATCLALAMLPSLTAYGIDFVARRPAQGLDADRLACVDWIKATVGSGVVGRVLCDDAELGNMIPYLTKREVIGGGLSSQAVIRNGWTCVDDNRAFGRPLAELSTDQLAQYLSLYNIGQAVVRTDVLKERLAAKPQTCTLIDKFGPFFLFTVKPERLEALWEGVYDGRVTGGPDRITIRSAPRGGFTINYHYLKTLKASNDITIRPVNLLDDPVPFIRVESLSGEDEIVLRNGRN